LTANATRPSATLTTKIGRNQVWSRASFFNCSALSSRRRFSSMTTPVTPYATVASASGPPIAAPTPMSLACSVLPVVTATRVTTDSGRAVPKAARMVPTAIFPTLSRRPSHSTALTNHSQDR
jgi:hypothetical protein